MTNIGNFQKMGKKHTQNSNTLMRNFIASDKNKQMKVFFAYRNNLKWLALNREKLRSKYGDKYVAVHKGRVCINKKDLSSLLSEVKKKYGTSQEVLVDFVGRKKVSLLL